MVNTATSTADSELEFGRKIFRIGPKDRPFMLIGARTAVITVSLWLATAVIAIFSLVDGSASITVAEAFAALTGNGDSYTNMIVVEWRAPRTLLAILLGATLAMSGAIFQNLTANPLGSPDVIGFQTGSYTGALIVMLIIGGGSTRTLIGALIGGITTALVVFFLASKRGFAGGVRLIIVGIAVSAMLASLNVWILLTASVEDAIMASLWGAGNLAGTSWNSLLLAVVGSAIFIVMAAFLARPMRLMQIGIPDSRRGCWYWPHCSSYRHRWPDFLYCTRRATDCPALSSRGWPGSGSHRSRGLIPVNPCGHGCTKN